MSKQRLNAHVSLGLSWNTASDQRQTWEATAASLSHGADGITLITLQHHVLIRTFWFFNKWTVVFAFL